MSADVLLFPRSQRPSEFHEAARRRAEDDNKEIKKFTNPELLQLAGLTQRPLQIGLIKSCTHFQHETGVMMQAFHTRNPAMIVFSLFKDMREGSAIRYHASVPLLNETVVIETSNTRELFARLGAGLDEACKEYQILYDISPPAPGFVRS